MKKLSVYAATSQVEYTTQSVFNSKALAFTVREDKMKHDDLMKVSENFSSYLEVLCKAILLNNVTINDGRIQVKSWND